MKSLSTALLLITMSSAAGAHDIPPNALPYEACAASEVREPCQYTSSSHRYTGTCQSINETLTCVRNRPIEHLMDNAEHAESTD